MNAIAAIDNAGSLVCLWEKEKAEIHGKEETVETSQKAKYLQ